MPIDELRKHADEVIRISGCPEKYREYIAILVNNEAWREQLAGIPFDRRLLMMPKCMRVENKCPAPFDEFGLLCKKCGLCSIQDLQEEAERLGYAVLVAEGSAIVTAIIQTGKIEAIVGVSCLSVLEKAFPHMEAAAIPGIAIPLLQDDCADTNVDLDWIWEFIHLSSDDHTRRMDLDKIREDIDTWFTIEQLAEQLGPSQGESDDIARAWLGKSGKRWRPFLTVCTYKALRGNPDAPVPDGLKKLAIAVECFHKA
jgi:geranylgeranyl diphosphate synthase type II